MTKRLPISCWHEVLPDAIHSNRSLLCSTTNTTPHERIFCFTRQSIVGRSIPTWLRHQGLFSSSDMFELISRRPWWRMLSSSKLITVRSCTPSWWTWNNGPHSTPDPSGRGDHNTWGSNLTTWEPSVFTPSSPEETEVIPKPVSESGTEALTDTPILDDSSTSSTPSKAEPPPYAVQSELTASRSFDAMNTSHKGVNDVKHFLLP